MSENQEKKYSFTVAFNELSKPELDEFFNHLTENYEVDVKAGYRRSNDLVLLFNNFVLNVYSLAKSVNMSETDERMSEHPKRVLEEIEAYSEKVLEGAKLILKGQVEIDKRNGAQIDELITYLIAMKLNEAAKK